MIRNSVTVTIEGKQYEVVVNVGSMINVEKISGKGFMTVLGGMEKGELIPITQLLSACMRDQKGNPVGTRFIENLSFSEVQSLLDPLMQAILKAFPESNGDEKNDETAQVTK